MGILNSTSSAALTAEKLVVLRDDGTATDVVLVFDSTVPKGQMRVEASLRRLSGVEVSLAIEHGDILVVRITKKGSSRSGGSIHISNTGNATAHGGGVANTGYYGGYSSGPSLALPASVSYNHLDHAPELPIRFEHGSTSRVIIRTADPNQPYMVNPV